MAMMQGNRYICDWNIGIQNGHKACIDMERQGVRFAKEGERAPEPMDVPAIQVPADSELENMGGDIFGCSNGGRLNLGHCAGGHTYSCADKSRVLLTDESGKKHCIKF